MKARFLLFTDTNGGNVAVVPKRVTHVTPTKRGAMIWIDGHSWVVQGTVSKTVSALGKELK